MLGLQPSLFPVITRALLIQGCKAVQVNTDIKRRLFPLYEVCGSTYRYLQFCTSHIPMPEEWWLGDVVSPHLFQRLVENPPQHRIRTWGLYMFKAAVSHYISSVLQSLLCLPVSHSNITRPPIISCSRPRRIFYGARGWDERPEGAIREFANETVH